MKAKFTTAEKDYFALLRARDIVATRWRKFGFGEDGGPRCARGALREVTGIATYCHGSCILQFYRLEDVLNRMSRTRFNHLSVIAGTRTSGLRHRWKSPSK